MLGRAAGIRSHQNQRVSYSNNYAYVRSNPYKFVDPAGLLLDCVRVFVGRSTTRENQQTLRTLAEFKIPLPENPRPGIGPNLDPWSPGKMPITLDYVADWWMW